MAGATLWMAVARKRPLTYRQSNLFSKFGHFRYLDDTPVQSAVNEYLAIDGGGNVHEWSSRVIAAWQECFTEKSGW